MNSTKELPTLNPDVINELRSLQEEGEEDVIVEITQTFLKSTIEMFKNFEVAQKAEKFEDIRIMAHTLKSATASVGAMRLCELVTELEKYVKSGQKENVSKMISAAYQEFVSFQNELKKFLD